MILGRLNHIGVATPAIAHHASKHYNHIVMSRSLPCRPNV